MDCIRPARQEDVEQLIELLRLLFSIEKDFVADTARQRQGLTMMLDNEQSLVLVAEAEGRVLGMCTGQLVVSTAEGGPSVLVEDMAVFPEHRGKGVGRALLAGLGEWAKKRGATRMQLLADADNQPALGYYRHLEWQETALVCWRKYIASK
ncbi:N-acetyltransferase family protein [Desulfobulbus propionicus]|jgi:ribosomal protein S18 acetylase RimI-like enzyme